MSVPRPERGLLQVSSDRAAARELAHGGLGGEAGECPYLSNCGIKHTITGLFFSVFQCPQSPTNIRHNVFIILFPQVGDKEIFVSEEEVGGSREALQELINKGETEVAVKHYKEEVRKLLGLPETVVSPELVETQSQQ